MGKGAEKLKEVLAKLDKKDREGLSFGNEIETTKLETPSLGLTAAFGGGFKMGGVSTIYGPKSAGKTAFMLQQIAIAQQQGLTCALFDVEKAFNKDWAESLGVDTADLVHSKAGTVTGFVNSANSLIRAGISPGSEGRYALGCTHDRWYCARTCIESGGIP